MIKNLIKKLTQKKLKISFAESCSGGLLASEITSVSGASKIFNIGLITYSNYAKINILKVNKKIIQKYGAVSSECCVAMAEGLSKISKANLNVSITGITGPRGGSKLKPVGLVYIGIKKGKKTLVIRNVFRSKSRISIQKATVKKAINIINSAI